VLHYDGSAWTGTSFNEGVLAGVWASAPNDVFAVGFDQAGGFILRYDGQLWSRMDAPSTPNGLSEVWGSSSSDVYAVGPETILHYDGSSWIQVSEEGGAEVFALSPADVYVVGGNGSVLHGTPQGPVAIRDSRVTNHPRALVTSHPARREPLGERSYGLPPGLPRPLSLERR
jgi:hypothetical protein